jgi:hypothetical protein
MKKNKIEWFEKVWSKYRREDGEIWNGVLCIPNTQTLEEYAKERKIEILDWEPCY